MSYTLKTTVAGEFDEVIDATTAALGDEGFGILSDIDVGATLSEKLDVDFRNYRVLGACNPALAHEVLSEQIQAGTLLPCSVAVYEDEEGVTVAAADPDDLLAIAESETIDEVGDEVGERFERVLAALDDEFDGTA